MIFGRNYKKAVDKVPSFDDETKQQFKKAVKTNRRRAVDLTQQADQHVERLLIKRFDRLVSVRRFIFLWVALFVILILSTVAQIRGLSPYYQKLKPVPGGIYSEGLIGTFTNANPIYATGAADSAVSHLVFNGLLKYDDTNKLVGDLAKDWVLTDAQNRYTVHLRHNIVWQDGKPFTADDVLYTYQTIQDIQAQSPLYTSWQGIKVSKQDNYTVNFDLPNALSSFPQALTNGIVPAHLLKNTAPEQLRSAPFNTSPVGTGPFTWKFVEVKGGTSEDREQLITMAAFNKYWPGKPKLDGFNLITFADEKHLVSAFRAKQVNSMSGLEAEPTELASDDSVQAQITPLTGSVMAFFNNSRPILSDSVVRKALVSGVDRSQINTLLQYPVKTADSPLLKDQLAYDPEIVQLQYNQKAAQQFLDQQGWKADSSGQMIKDGKPLQITISSQDTQDYTKIAHYLQKQWGDLGVKVNVNYYSGEDLQSQIISGHDYDVLLYGIAIGVDPDVFAYWHSSQISLSSLGHLNLSEYKSTTADSALESGRTRADPAIRTIKYKPFLKSWAQDAPALALYQPNFVYITRGPVFNYARKANNSGVDRFYNVQNWEIRQKRQSD